MANDPPDVLTNRLREFFQACLNACQEHAMLLPTDPAIDVDHEIESLNAHVGLLRNRLKRRKFDPAVRREANELLRSDGGHSDNFELASSGVLRAKIEEARILAAMLSGDFAETMPLDPLFAGTTPNGLPPLPGDAPSVNAKEHPNRSGFPGGPES